MNVFEKAFRFKFRFKTGIGYITAEDLWDLPLKTKNLNLNTVAKTINDDLKSLTDESFVPDIAPNAEVQLLEDMLELVKSVIKTKLDEQAIAALAATKARRHTKLVGLLAKKQDDKDGELTEDEIVKELAELVA